jgi:predicted heme/steroid binding protein
MAASDKRSGCTRGCGRFTPQMLARCDGSDEHLPILLAHGGRVYDVSHSFLWREGRHFWHVAGRDLTEAMRHAPHGEDMLRRVPCVGVLDPTAEP